MAATICKYAWKPVQATCKECSKCTESWLGACGRCIEGIAKCCDRCCTSCSGCCRSCNATLHSCGQSCNVSCCTSLSVLFCNPINPTPWFLILTICIHAIPAVPLLIITAVNWPGERTVVATGNSTCAGHQDPPLHSFVLIQCIVFIFNVVFAKHFYDSFIRIPQPSMLPGEEESISTYQTRTKSRGKARGTGSVCCEVCKACCGCCQLITKCCSFLVETNCTKEDCMTMCGGEDFEYSVDRSLHLLMYDWVMALYFLIFGGQIYWFVKGFMWISDTNLVCGQPGTATLLAASEVCMWLVAAYLAYLTLYVSCCGFFCLEECRVPKALPGEEGDMESLRGAEQLTPQVTTMQHCDDRQVTVTGTGNHGRRVEGLRRSRSNQFLTEDWVDHTASTTVSAQNLPEAGVPVATAVAMSPPQPDADREHLTTAEAARAKALDVASAAAQRGHAAAGAAKRGIARGFMRFGQKMQERRLARSNAPEPESTADARA